LIAGSFDIMNYSPYLYDERKIMLSDIVERSGHWFIWEEGE